MPRNNQIFLGVRAVCASLICVALAGCDNSQAETDPLDALNGTPTPEQLRQLEAATTLSSEFGTPDVNGNFSDPLSSLFFGNVKNRFGNGYGYELSQDGTHFTARVGLLPQNDHGPLPASGLATFRGEYQVAQVGISDGDLRAYGEVQHDKGLITLTADFDFGTLKGETGLLIIDGRFENAALRGDAFYDSRRAEMIGNIGNLGAVGVFHNTNSETALLGGFTVAP